MKPAAAHATIPPVTQADFRASLRAWLRDGVPPRPGNEAEAAALAAAARQQGLAGLLYPRSAGWPRAAREELRASYAHGFGLGVAQLEALGRVQRLLLERGLRSLPLKGGALVERLCDSAAERPMADVDLLVLDDWTAAARALTDEGWLPLRRADHAQPFVEPDSGVVLELHRSVTSCGALFPLDAEALWGRSQPGPGRVPRLPSPEDLLVHLSLHAAFQHGLVLTLVQYLDFRRLLERLPPRPDRLAESAERARAGRAVAAALRAAEAVVGARPRGDLAAALDRWLPEPPGWLRAGLADPLRFVAPEPPALARVRWGLAGGRRIALLRAALLPEEPEVAGPRSLRAAGRVLYLLRRWAAPTLRAWRRA